jgi:hypothetical protein
LKQYRSLLVILILALAIPAGAQKAGLTSSAALMSRLASLQTADAASGTGRMKLASIGQSAKGKDIPMVTIVDPTAVPETTKKLFIICRQHGNEPASTEAMLSLINQLVTKTDDTTKDILSKVAFYIVPMMNPDGADAFQRRNANGADLNRDWLNLWQPETRAVRAAIDSVAPDVIIDEHELSPTNRNSDFVESAGPSSGAPADVAEECQKMQSLVVGMLRTHDMGVVSYEIADQHPARLAHRYFPIHAGTKTILFESRQSGGRRNQLAYREELHIVGTMTVAKYLAGMENDLYDRIAAHDAKRFIMLASRGVNPTSKQYTRQLAPIKHAPAKHYSTKHYSTRHYSTKRHTSSSHYRRRR